MIQSLFISSVLIFLSISAYAQDNSNTCPLNNVCFVLDASGSINNSEYSDIQNFTVTAALQIATRTIDTIYSAYAFSGVVATIQDPTMDLNGEFIPAVNGPRLISGSTNIGLGIQQCLNAQRGEPGNLVTVLLTDGQGAGNALQLKTEFTAAGIDIVTVGIGNGVNVNFLQQLATTPDFYFPVSDTSELVERVTEAVDDICQVTVSDSCEAAYQNCDFQFMDQDTVPEYKIGEKPDFVFTDRIVSRNNSDVGILNTNGIDVEFLVNGSTIPITSFGNPSLTPTHFKPLSITTSPLSTGIGHQTFTGNQLEVSRGRCVRIYFTSFQEILLNQNPRVIDNVNDASKSDNKCVVFRTM